MLEHAENMSTSIENILAIREEKRYCSNYNSEEVPDTPRPNIQ